MPECIIQRHRVHLSINNCLCHFILLAFPSVKRRKDQYHTILAFYKLPREITTKWAKATWTSIQTTKEHNNTANKDESG